jgi:endonuclease/exonuclease/phosphatase family metal-dependent hydrolase
MSENVPLDAPGRVRVPGRINPNQQTARDIATIAREFDLSLVYLPSMPNGRRTQEDRGSAILSTLPVSDVMGIELPWVSQRRVAVMATVTATNQGKPWRLRVVSAHLDNRLGRAKQAAAIADFLNELESPELPVVIGADLNSWFGVRDQAVQEIHSVIPRVQECGDQATFRFGLRLDHVFTTLPKETHAGCFVDRDSFGSDHYPILLRFIMPKESA